MSRHESALSPELEARFLEPYTYFIRHSSKHICAKFVQAFDYWLKIPQDKQETISSILDRVKNGGLVVDDIQDNTILRQGLPVAHHIYGIPLTLNAGNHALILAIESLLDGFPSETHSAGLRIFTQQMLQMHRGQGLEIQWRETLVCPTEEAYIEMAHRKSTSGILMVVRLMQLFSEDKRDFSKLVQLMGTYFQLDNDYDNLKSKKYAEYKSFADDLTEGKFSFPIIHAIRSRPDDKAIINILKHQTENVEMKKYALSQMEEFGSFAYTQMVMNEVWEKALDEVEKLGGNPYIQGFFEYLKAKQL